MQRVEVLGELAEEVAAELPAGAAVDEHQQRDGVLGEQGRVDGGDAGVLAVSFLAEDLPHDLLGAPDEGRAKWRLSDALRGQDEPRVLGLAQGEVPPLLRASPLLIPRDCPLRAQQDAHERHHQLKPLSRRVMREVLRQRDVLDDGRDVDHPSLDVHALGEVHPLEALRECGEVKEPVIAGNPGGPRADVRALHVPHFVCP